MSLLLISSWSSFPVSQFGMGIGSSQLVACHYVLDIISSSLSTSSVPGIRKVTHSDGDASRRGTDPVWNFPVALRGPFTIEE